MNYTTLTGTTNPAKMRRKNYSYSFIAFLCLMAMISPIKAITPSEPNLADSLKADTISITSKTTQLKELRITATLARIPLAQTTKGMTIISQTEIRQAPVQSVEELLLFAASVDVVQRGQHGVQADISVRGGTSDQVAILLNGINITNAQTGHYNFDIPLNLSDIDYIEILHGPSALVYGVNAFSGGINIITTKAADKKLYAMTELGMYGLRNMEIRGAVELGATTNSLSVGYKSSSGYIANSDYDIFNILWQTRLALKAENIIDFQLGYNKKMYGANTFYSGKFPDQYERTSSYIGTVKGEFGSKRLRITPILYWNRHYDQYDLVKDTDFGQNYHLNEMYGANLILSYQSKLGTTSLAGELRHEEILSSKLGEPRGKRDPRYTKYDNRLNLSVGLEHTVSIKQLTLSGGVLVNRNTLESGKYRFFPTFGLGYWVSDRVKLFSSWSKSARMPTFTDLYYTNETHTANQGLQAERSESLELGVQYNSRVLNLYATGFMLWGKNIIDWVKLNPTDEKWRSWNHSRLDNKGVELGAQLSIGELFPALGKESTLRIDYTQIYQRYDAQELLSVATLNYLKTKVTARLTHPIYRGLSAAWYFRYQKRAGRYEHYENLLPVGQHKYPSFTTLDLRLSYQIKGFKINLDFNNLYNTDYYDKGNVPQAGFWFKAGVSYQL